MITHSISKNSIQDQKKEEFRKGLFYVACLLLFWGITIIAGYTYIRSNIRSEMNRQKLQEIDLMCDRIHDIFSRIEVHLVYIANLHTVHQTLKQENPEARAQVERLFKRIIEVHINRFSPDFDQIRLLDLNGYEKVRVNLDKDKKGKIIPVDQLQDKSSRYYFREAINLTDSQMYMSPLDLNIENGIVETPHKPMIRFSVPVFDTEKNRIGVLILNYLAQQIFNDLDKINKQKGNQWLLLNQDGFYLHGTDPEKDFAFMFSDKKAGFSYDHPDLWKKILTTDEKTFSQSEGMYFRKDITPFKTDTLMTMAQFHKWTLLMFVPTENVYQQEKRHNWNTLLLNIIMIPVLTFLGWSLGKSRVKNKWYLKSLEESATQDGMTGLINHREAMKRLEYQINLSQRTQNPLSIVFIDLNDLKSMNDTLGHKSGDQMIIAAAQSITDSIRNTDIAARLGGDEFIVIFPDLETKNAHLAVERIEHLYAQKGQTLFHRELTLSWGLSFWEGKSDTAKNLIARADENMYKMKQAYKQGRSKSDRP